MFSKAFIIRLALQQKETYTELFLYLLILDGSTISKQFFLEIRKVSSIIGSVILLEELALFMQDSSISSKLYYRPKLEYTEAPYHIAFYGGILSCKCISIQSTTL